MVDISVKQRIIKLKEIFENETDEFNKLSLQDLIDKLTKEFDYESAGKFSVDKKAIKDDLNKLKASGFSINIDTVAKGKKLYYHNERLFELYELSLLIDAVSSARFITKQETETIINKIKRLTSKGLAKKLQNRIHIDGMVKSENSRLKYYLDSIHSAILEHKKIRFQYGNYSTNKEFSLHHDGAYYIVEPYALVWNNDFYYLICNDVKKKKILNYRVDRMVNVVEADQTFKKDDFDITKYLEQSFNMYPGRVDVVEIQFNNGLLNAIIDRLGKNLTMWKADNNSFIVRFKAAINEGLLRWMLMWGADAKVLNPPQLINMIKDENKKINEIYK